MCDFDLCIECTTAPPVAAVPARVVRVTGLPNPPAQPQPFPEFDSIVDSDLAQTHDRSAADPVASFPSAFMNLPECRRLQAQPQLLHSLDSISASEVAPNFTVRNPSRMKLKPKPTSLQLPHEFDSIADSILAQTLSLYTPDRTAVEPDAPVQAVLINSPGYHRSQAQPKLLQALDSISASDIAPHFTVRNSSRMKLKPKHASHLHAHERDAQLDTECHVLPDPIRVILVLTKHPIVCDNFFWC